MTQLRRIRVLYTYQYVKAHTLDPRTVKNSFDSLDQDWINYGSIIENTLFLTLR
jgi:hypothetical protein